MELYNRRSLYVFLIAILGGIIFYFSIGSIAKSVAEKIATEVLGTKVSIGSLDINAKDNVVTIENLRIANPKGYTKEESYALTIGRINIDAEELLEGLVVFSEVKVENAEVFLVVTENGANFVEFKNNINKYRESSVKKYSDDDRGPPDVIIKHLDVVGAKLHPKVTMVNQKLQSVSIPEIEIVGIGERENGISAGRAVAIIWYELTNAAVEASDKTGLFNNLPPHYMNRIYDATRLPSSLIEGAEGSARDANESLKHLFGR